MKKVAEEIMEEQEKRARNKFFKTQIWTILIFFLTMSVFVGIDIYLTVHLDNMQHRPIPSQIVTRYFKLKDGKRVPCIVQNGEIIDCDWGALK